MRKKNDENAQYCHSVRYQIEFDLLPDMMFSRTADFFAWLARDKADLLYRIYASPFEERGGCPYAPDEFAVEIIEEHAPLRIIKATLPQTCLGVPLCERVYFVWNEETGDAYYFTVEMALDYRTEMPMHMLCGVGADKTHFNHGAAPQQSDELGAVLSIVHGG